MTTAAILCILILFWPNHRDFAKHGQGLLCSGVVLAKWWWLSELAASPLSQSLKVTIATILSKRIGKTLDQLNNSNSRLAWNTSSFPPALPAELGGEVPLGQISTFIVGSQPSHHSNSNNTIQTSLPKGCLPSRRPTCTCTKAACSISNATCPPQYVGSANTWAVFSTWNHRGTPIRCQHPITSNHHSSMSPSPIGQVLLRNLLRPRIYESGTVCRLDFRGVQNDTVWQRTHDTYPH